MGFFSKKNKMSDYPVAEHAEQSSSSGEAESETIQEQAILSTDYGIREESILCTLTNLLVCLSWFIFIRSFYQNLLPMVLTGSLIPGVFVLFEEWMVSKRPNLLVYFLLHGLILALAAGALLYGSGTVDILTILFLVVITVMGITARMHETIFFHPRWPLFIPCIIQFILGYYTQTPIAIHTAQISIVAAALLMVLWYNVDSISKTLLATHTKATIPYEQIHKNNRSVILSTILVCAMIIVPVVLFTSGEKFFSAIGQFFYTLLKNIALLIGRFFSLLGMESQDEGTSAGASTTDFDFTEASERMGNPILEKIWNVCVVILLCFVIFLIVRAIVRFLKRFRKNFNKAVSLDGDQIEYIRPGETRNSVYEKDKDNPLKRFSRSPKQKIRRMYQKTIQSGRGAKNIRESHTPEELEKTSLSSDTAMDSTSSARMQMHELYEKARYSNDECTKEEVSKMKEQLRQVKNPS